ncbi:uncharacterized protein G2W53_003985 [Senna tora]|uniref:Uncharacterized protein n=1 Tax=Senna tora TaxID=362788 RepID=A0A834XC19_9FABA|nr:uncharacterized protein G2W53_003985 [Senna tora]
MTYWDIGHLNEHKKGMETECKYKRMEHVGMFLIVNFVSILGCYGQARVMHI